MARRRADRHAGNRDADSIAVMTSALDEHSSLILFPEGTRNMTDEPVLPFKSGLYHLALARPDVELVPVWIENLNRVMPKGEIIPVPFFCEIRLGAPLKCSGARQQIVHSLEEAVRALKEA